MNDWKIRKITTFCGGFDHCSCWVEYIGYIHINIDTLYLEIWCRVEVYGRSLDGDILVVKKNAGVPWNCPCLRCLPRRDTTNYPPLAGTHKSIHIDLLINTDRFSVDKPSRRDGGRAISKTRRGLEKTGPWFHFRGAMVLKLKPWQSEPWPGFSRVKPRFHFRGASSTVFFLRDGLTFSTFSQAYKPYVRGRGVYVQCTLFKITENVDKKLTFFSWNNKRPQK